MVPRSPMQSESTTVPNSMPCCHFLACLCGFTIDTHITDCLVLPASELPMIESIRRQVLLLALLLYNLTSWDSFTLICVAIGHSCSLIRNIPIKRTCHIFVCPYIFGGHSGFTFKSFKSSQTQCRYAYFCGHTCARLCVPESEAAGGKKVCGGTILLGDASCFPKQPCQVRFPPAGINSARGGTHCGWCVILSDS